MLVRLIYKSRVSRDFSFAASLDIFSKSTVNNRKLEITGLLISNRKEFLQVLEGPAGNVNELYKVILGDKRHEAAQLISYREIETRLFQDWRMRPFTLEWIEEPFRSFVGRKYDSGNAFENLPDDPDLALSLLLDAKILAEKSKGRKVSEETASDT